MREKEERSNTKKEEEEENKPNAVIVFISRTVSFEQYLQKTATPHTTASF